MPRQSQQYSVGGSSAPPPAYRSDRSNYRYEEEEEEEEEDQEYISDEEILRRPTSRMPAAMDSSRAVANEGVYNNEAGIGAGGNAYNNPDTPSMYTDPYEYSTVVGGANVMSTRPDPNYLMHDPYAGSPIDLRRSNTIGTLGPGDSVSAYNVNAISRNLHGGSGHDQGLSQDSQFERRPYSSHQEHYRIEDSMQDFHDPSYGGQRPYEMSSDDVPLQKYPAGMGYAEDEDQEQRQREAYWNGYPQEEKWDHQNHPPSLFANNLQGPPPFSSTTKGLEEGGEDRRGLLGKFGSPSSNGIKPGWGGTLNEQIARRKRGIGRQRWPILTWLLTIAYIVVFIIELIQGKQKTGQAIQTSPSWNPMLGPSFEFLISFGARFVPCMRKVADIPTSTEMACLSYSTATSLTSSELCPIWQLCGLANADTTNQAYRFVTPIFIHAGFIHIGFNLLVQLTLCAQIEKLISTPFYALIYFAGGIGGNLLGGNFGLVGQPSVGASGAIYTCISVELIDLCYNWKYVSATSLHYEEK